jgi:hypothetical protein
MGSGQIYAPLFSPAGLLARPATPLAGAIGNRQNPSVNNNSGPILSLSSTPIHAGNSNFLDLYSAGRGNAFPYVVLILMECNRGIKGTIPLLGKHRQNTINSSLTPWLSPPSPLVHPCNRHHSPFRSAMLS